MKFDSRCRYNPTHEWIRVEGDEGVIGISDYAQSELNDVVYVDLPEVGDALEKGDEFGSVESVKAASELYAPVSGEVIAVNGLLEDAPELINKAPYEDGWMIRIKMSDTREKGKFMSASEYQSYIEEETEEE